jgi:hypothetical protein
MTNDPALLVVLPSLPGKAFRRRSDPTERVRCFRVGQMRSVFGWKLADGLVLVGYRWVRIVTH